MINENPVKTLIREKLQRDTFFVSQANVGVYDMNYMRLSGWLKAFREIAEGHEGPEYILMMICIRAHIEELQRLIKDDENENTNS